MLLHLLAFGLCLTLLGTLWVYLYRQDVELRRLRQLAELRAERVTVLSHEVRTPLAMIRAAAELLLDGSPGPVTERQRTFLATISQSCERLITLAEDLLTQARIDAGVFQLRLQPTNLKALARQVVRSLRPLIDAQEQTVLVHAPQILPSARVDPRLIQQTLTNLLHNASRHTSRGGHIYLTLAQAEAAITIAVTDDGAGMSRDERRQLFQKFASGRPAEDGTGLGLVISKQIIEHHGGRILVDTSLGQGTTFLITLPLISALRAAAQKAPQHG